MHSPVQKLPEEIPAVGEPPEGGIWGSDAVEGGIWGSDAGGCAPASASSAMDTDASSHDDAIYDRVVPRGVRRALVDLFPLDVAGRDPGEAYTEVQTMREPDFMKEEGSRREIHSTCVYIIFSSEHVKVVAGIMNECMCKYGAQVV